MYTHATGKMAANSRGFFSWLNCKLKCNFPVAFTFANGAMVVTCNYFCKDDSRLLHVV